MTVAIAVIAVLAVFIVIILGAAILLAMIANTYLTRLRSAGRLSGGGR